MRFIAHQTATRTGHPNGHPSSVFSSAVSGWQAGSRVSWSDNLVDFLRRWLGAARDLRHGRHYRCSTQGSTTQSNSRSPPTAPCRSRIPRHSANLTGSAQFLRIVIPKSYLRVRPLQHLLDIVWVVVLIPATLARVLSDLCKHPSRKQCYETFGMPF